VAPGPYVRAAWMFARSLHSYHPDLSPGFSRQGFDFEVKGRPADLKGWSPRRTPALAVEHGADAIIVFKPRRRNEDTGRATVDCLPEVAAGARGRIPVFLDGGVRRGNRRVSRHWRSAQPLSDWVARKRGDWLRSAAPASKRLIDILNRELSAIHATGGHPDNRRYPILTRGPIAVTPIRLFTLAEAMTADSRRLPVKHWLRHYLFGLRTRCADAPEGQ